MYDDPDMDRAVEMVDAVASELVDSGVSPADARFACQLLREHYEAASDREYGSRVSCEFAWRLAREIATLVEENPEIDWLNAYFIGKGVVDSFRRPDFEAGLPEGHDDPHHPEWVTGEARGAAEGVEDALAEFVEVASLHVDLDEPIEEAGEMDRAALLAMTFGHLDTRYAHDLPDDMLESAAGMELTGVVSEFSEREGASRRELVMGGRLVENWLEHRCKNEHVALCVTE